MDAVESRELAENYFKALSAEEGQRTMAFLENLTPENTRLVITAGQIYHRSSAVNGTWFWRTVPVIAAALPEDVFNLWLTEGAGICRGNWEGALSFLKAGPDLIGQISPAVFANWMRIGRGLIRYSNHDAIWFFKHSADILNKLTGEQQLLLTDWNLRILTGSWPAAAACFKTWPEIIRLQSDRGQQADLLRLGLELSGAMPEEAAAYFLALPAFLRQAGAGFLRPWVAGAAVIDSRLRGVAAAYFKATPGLAERIKPALDSRLGQWAAWGSRLAGTDSRVGEAFLAVTPQVLESLPWTDMESWVDLIDRVQSGFSAAGALEFVRQSPGLLIQLDVKELAQWAANGLKTVKDDKRLAYFTLKSQESRDAIVRLRSGLPLETIKKVLFLYYEGLTGETAVIRNTSDLPGRILDGDRLFTSLDTRRIYLPDLVRVFPENQDNLRLYRVMLMHQAAHREFGTLALDKKYFRELAENNYLGLLFEYLEDARVDYLAMQKYPGLDRDCRRLLAVNPSTAGSSGGKNSAPVIVFLKHYLWPDENASACPVAPEIQAVVGEYWRKVTDTGASALESLQTARRLLVMAGHEAVHQLPVNLIYRGRLKYDLLYTSLLLDEELGGEQPEQYGQPEQHGHPAGEVSPAVGKTCEFNPHSDFYLALKKLLAKFVADEENPYRLIAYYDEWDRSLNDYKKDWCRVREILLKPSNARFVQQTLEENYGMTTTLKRYFGMLRPDRFRRYGRQEDGEDIDLDAVVEAMIEKRAGFSPTGGFYIRRDKRERDVAVGFLLDLSYSTEEVIPGTGKTLLEVEQESVIVMSEALEVLGDKYAVYGFNSDGRDQVNFYVVKDFAEANTLEVKQRYGGLKSHGMTRLAAATRHAVKKLNEVQAAIRILILLSDGRPYDNDYNSGLSRDYEQFYAETDTRMALREARMQGINPFCITMDNKGQEYMEYIFGNVSYIIIDDVMALPVKMTEIYKNLTT